MHLAPHIGLPSPENIELEKRKAQLAELEESLASSELERATLETELLRFQRLCYPNSIDDCNAI